MSDTLSPEAHSGRAGEWGQALEGKLTLSPRTKFALKTALAITIAYLVPLAMGWNQPQQGAIAIMVIASMDSMRETLGKGVMRVVGTILGGALGLMVMALFPQDRFAYLALVSILAAVMIYLYRTTEGDGTLWLMSLLMMLFVFNGGETEGRFVYVMERTWTTAFGIFVYAMVQVYLWPESRREPRIDWAAGIVADWKALLKNSGPEASGGVKKMEALASKMRQLQKSLSSPATDYLVDGTALDEQRWAAIYPRMQRVQLALGRLVLLERAAPMEVGEELLRGYEACMGSIHASLEAIEKFWSAPEVPWPPSGDCKLRLGDPPALNAVQRAYLLSFMERLRELHDTLEDLGSALRQIHSPRPDLHEWMPKWVHKEPRDWLDLWEWRGTLVSLLVFWTGMGLWIGFNTPLGYMVAALGTVLSLVTVFAPVHPMALLLIYSLSFVVSFIGYVGILPHLDQGWELALYIFGYMFLAYYFIPLPLALFFALGLGFQSILNDIFFSFQLFITILTMFYLFLGLLLFFNYVPFSNRPESNYLRARRHFEGLLRRVLAPGNSPARRKMLLRVMRKDLERMELWAQALDLRYFDRIEMDRLRESIERSKELWMMLKIHASLPGAGWKDLEEIEQKAWQSFFGRGQRSLEDLRESFRRLSRSLDRLLQERIPRQVSSHEIARSAEGVALGTAIWKTLLEREEADRLSRWQQLRWSRF